MACLAVPRRQAKLGQDAEIQIPLRAHGQLYLHYINWWQRRGRAGALSRTSLLLINACTCGCAFMPAGGGSGAARQGVTNEESTLRQLHDALHQFLELVPRR